jgi:hypothetical protein
MLMRSYRLSTQAALDIVQRAEQAEVEAAADAAPYCKYWHIARQNIA